MWRGVWQGADQNLAIDKVVPVRASVKTKLGRGGSYED